MGPAVSGHGRWFILYQLMSVALGSIWLMSWEVRHAEAAVSVFWTDLTLSGSKPSPRHGPSMAYDTARGQVVLFGGTGSTGLFQDTWVWDGATQTWTDVTPSGAKPSARWGAIMVYDIAQGRMVLFGGWDGSTVRGDTWAYDDDNEVRQGFWTIDECRDPISNEPCYWHYRYHRGPGHCPPGQPCAKLLVFFSTGIQTCDAPQTFTATDGKGKILEAYAVNDTYIAVCANTFLTPEGTDTRPFNEEDQRVDQLMRNIADQTGSSPTPQAGFSYTVLGVALTGAPPPAGVPALSLDTRHLDFGTEGVDRGGETSGFHIRNDGGVPLTITAWGPFTPPFSLYSRELQPPFTLAPAQMELVYVSFVPKVPGRYRQRLFIRSDDPDQPVAVVTLSGRGKDWGR